MNWSKQSNQARELDTIFIENPDYGVIEVLTNCRLTNDLTMPGEFGFEIGNDDTYNEFVDRAIGMGSPFRVFVNDRLHISGRVEFSEVPMSADNGAIMRAIVRTKLADAYYASADPSIRVARGTTIRDFLLAVYAPLGYTESDFVFNADVSRNLMTGRNATGTKSPVALDDIKEEQLRINPPETIYAAADRILKRHGLMHWDSPDGRLVVGAPDDTQEPAFSFRMFNDSRSWQNNIISCNRKRDFSQAPAVLGVYGIGGGKGWKKSKVGSVQTLADVADIKDSSGNPVFYRPTMVINEGVKTDSLAERHAKRELTNRSKQVDCWNVVFDGLSFWDGKTRTPVAPDTVADIQTSLGGGPKGAYLITRVEKTRNVDNADTTSITLLKKGLWAL